MGLDLVEMLMVLEETFDVSIPDEDADRMRTPRDCVEWLVSHVVLSGGRCGSLRAFYRLRRAIRQCQAWTGEAIRPGTRWDRVLPGARSRAAWKRIRQCAGLYLPVPGPGATVGDTALLARDLYPEKLFDPGQGWNRDRIANVVNRCTREVFPGRSFTESTLFVDME